jgi:HEAT repeat protein
VNLFSEIDMIRNGLALLLILAAVPVLWAEEPAAGHDDEMLLRGVGVATDGKGLLTFFEQRRAGAGGPEKIEKRVAELVDQLAGDDAAAAQKACGELVALGAPAIPLLRQAARDPDQAQAVTLARRCLGVLENHPGQLTSAAVRLLGQRRPKGSTEALLAFLPSAEDDDVLETVRTTLASLARPEGKPDPALLAALKDPLALRRAMAIDALCQQGQAEPRATLARLLRDPMASVRLRAALALARVRDAEAVRMLIQLITELPLAQAQEAEVVLLDLAGEDAPQAPLTEEKASQQACRQAWEAWWKKMDDRQLLQEVRKRTLTEERLRKADALIKQLEDDDFQAREQAQRGLIDMGIMVMPLLRKALDHPDEEVRRRLRLCLRTLERDKSLPLPPVVARMLALRKPQGAVETLLTFAPYADSAELRHEVQIALNALAAQENKPHQALVRTLGDTMAIRRGAAAEAICLSTGPGDHLPAIRKLLEDADKSVRMQTALALASIGHRQAMPVLIQVLGDLPMEQSAPAVDYLDRLAQDRPPTDLPRGDTEEDRAKLREVWAAWWKANGEHTSLVSRYPADSQMQVPSITLVVYNNNQVVALDRGSKERWQVNGLLGPQDACLVGHNRLLVAESQGQRVTERNLRGDILWKHQTPGCWPTQVQRLPNGHTFIVCRNRLIEVDRAGRETLAIPRLQNDVLCARRLRNGEITLVSANQQGCLRLDATGKELQRFAINPLNHQGTDILANGHVLVPVPWMNKVQEYDAAGKVVWEASVPQAGSVCRAPNGHTLVSVAQFQPNRLFELDRKGQKVNEVALTGHVIRMQRR